MFCMLRPAQLASLDVDLTVVVHGMVLSGGDHVPSKHCNVDVTS